LSLFLIQIMSPCNPIHFSKIHFHIIPSTPRSNKWCLSFWFCPSKPCIHLPSHQCHMPCPSHAPWSGTLLIFSEEYKSCSSALCTLLQPPVTSFPFCPNTFLSSLFKTPLAYSSSLNMRHYIT
jgi:hypothetical protein